jgi:Ca2+-binding EF-hand superfamily protein
MLFAVGAASSMLDALQSLTAKKTTSTPTTGLTQNSKTAFDPGSLTADVTTSTAGSGGSAKSGVLSPSTMSALLAAQSQSSGAATSTSRSDALKDLFAQIDGNGDGQISKSEFESALGAGGTNTANADSVFSKLDKNGDGSVSLDEMSSALKGKGHHRHHVADSNSSGKSADGATDPLLQALQGASSTSTTNSDGTTTTSMTYADGSKVTMTSAPGSTSSGTSSSSATSSYNFIEQMIQRQAQAISTQATSSLSVSV